MLRRYEKFLEIFDAELAEYFELHKDYICCKKGCTDCCEIGEYPFSRLEAEYIMRGFITLDSDIQKTVKQNIKNLAEQKRKCLSPRFLYRCPFLVNRECVLYKYRGIVCRTFGLAYITDNHVNLPECATFGLNYSAVYSKTSHEITLENPIKKDLHIDKVLKSPIAEQFCLECGEIRPLIDWFTG